MVVAIAYLVVSLKKLNQAEGCTAIRERFPPLARQRDQRDAAGRDCHAEPLRHGQPLVQYDAGEEHTVLAG